MLGGDAFFLISGVEAPVAIESFGLILVELVWSHLLEDSVVRPKVNKYASKVSHIKEWIDWMFVFKNEALHDQIFDKKETAL